MGKNILQFSGQSKYYIIDNVLTSGSNAKVYITTRYKNKPKKNPIKKSGVSSNQDPDDFNGEIFTLTKSTYEKFEKSHLKKTEKIIRESAPQIQSENGNALWKQQCIRAVQHQYENNKINYKDLYRYIVFVYYQGGSAPSVQCYTKFPKRAYSLSNLLSSEKKSSLKESRLLNITIELLVKMSDLHQITHAAHLDLSPGNIMFSSDNKLQPIDYSGSRLKDTPPNRGINPLSHYMRLKHTDCKITPSFDAITIATTIFALIDKCLSGDKGPITYQTFHGNIYNPAVKMVRNTMTSQEYLKNVDSALNSYTIQLKEKLIEHKGSFKDDTILQAAFEIATEMLNVARQNKIPPNTEKGSLQYYINKFRALQQPHKRLHVQIAKNQSILMPIRSNSRTKNTNIRPPLPMSTTKMTSNNRDTSMRGPRDSRKRKRIGSEEAAENRVKKKRKKNETHALEATNNNENQTALNRR